MKIKETMANETSTDMTKKDFQFFLTKEAGATDGYSKFVTLQPVNKSQIRLVTMFRWITYPRLIGLQR